MSLGEPGRRSCDACALPPPRISENACWGRVRQTQGPEAPQAAGFSFSTTIFIGRAALITQRTAQFTRPGAKPATVGS
jgi:hypothetical protein